ncbi:MAG: hypothetical protein EBW84_11915 [Betaproteobacteria bacterium]|nr:hypothetical protein [Betaproteobacteria bacterium]
MMRLVRLWLQQLLARQWCRQGQRANRLVAWDGFLARMIFSASQTQRLMILRESDPHNCRANDAIIKPCDQTGLRSHIL